jgi:2,3-bisphosphoglycerate-dependent phosphoglycerate mutase
MTRLILIRHGETDWNTEGRWQGQVDVPLNATGRRQAQRMARSLKSAAIMAIYSSDLQRARQTAQVLADSTGLPLHLDSRLREIHQGEWQGLLFSEIQARYTQAYQDRQRDPLNFSPPGGEAVAQVRERVVAAIREIVRQHPDEAVAIVLHGFVLAVLIAHLRGQPFDQVWDLIPGNGQWVVIEGIIEDSLLS